MTSLVMKRMSLFHLLALVFGALFRIPQFLIKPFIRSRSEEKSNFSPNFFRSPAKHTMRYIVKHSYHAIQARKRRGKAIKRNLSYVSSMILEDYGEILSRKERRRRSVFTPYYN